MYMYRPVEQLDPDTKLVVGYTQKFAADTWQQSRQALANHFGISRKEVDAGLDTLIHLGLICTELRTMTISGQRVSNLMYIGLNALKVKEFSTPISPRGDSCTPGVVKVSPLKDRPIPPAGETYTKTPQTAPNKTTTGGVLYSASPVPLPLDAQSPEILQLFNQAIETHGYEFVAYTVQRAAAKARSTPGGHIRVALEALNKGKDWYACERAKAKKRESAKSTKSKADEELERANQEAAATIHRARLKEDFNLLPDSEREYFMQLAERKCREAGMWQSENVVKTVALDLFEQRRPLPVQKATATADHQHRSLRPSQA